MVFKTKKQGQAAIEFLMTYGWMLLVVLIVGALIFTFVDFGSLLPNKVDFASGAIRGDPQSSLAYSQAVAVTPNQVVIAFSYTGATKVSVPFDNTALTESISGNECTLDQIINDNTGETGSAPGDEVSFLNGHLGAVSFTCDGAVGPPAIAGPLLSDDVFEGTVAIGTKNPERSIVVPNTGDIRLTITG